MAEDVRRAFLQDGDCTARLTPGQVDPVLKLARAAYTVTTRVGPLLQQFPYLTEFQADYVVRLAKLLQQHRVCTSYCGDGDADVGETCKKYFPRVPSLYWYIAFTPKLTCKEERDCFATVVEFLASFKKVLRSDRSPV